MLTNLKFKGCVAPFLKFKSGIPRFCLFLKLKEVWKGQRLYSNAKIHTVIQERMKVKTKCLLRFSLTRMLFEILRKQYLICSKLIIYQKCCFNYYTWFMYKTLINSLNALNLLIHSSFSYLKFLNRQKYK